MKSSLCFISFAAVCPEITLGPGIASVEYSNMERIIGSNATHVCNETFVPDDDLVRVCEQVNETTAAWSLPEETCRRMLLYTNVS